MLRYCYTLFYYLCAPLLCLRWIYKSFQPPQYREPMRERFGFVKPQSRNSIWFHAVSMGESNAAKAIIQQLLAKHPELNIVVTTTTPTGAKQIIEGLGDAVTHHYSPCDLPGTIKRFVKRIKPKALIIMETELWPNWLHYLKISEVPVVLANARLSQKSADQYSKIASLSQQMMSALTLVLPVGEQDGQRYIDLGLEPGRCRVTGNIKFDQTFDINGHDSYFPMWDDPLAAHSSNHSSNHSSDEKSLGGASSSDKVESAVWIAASTHKGEDEIILKAHQKILQELPDAKLIIVPRHPERFSEVAQLISSYELKFSRRSQPDDWDKSSQVLLGDSMGEMMMAFKLAQVAFVAGSLIPVGGHNIIEPASIGKPVLSGPYVHNFAEVFKELEASGGAKTAASEGDISSIVIDLLGSPEKAREMGCRAKAVIEKNRGALDKTIQELEAFIFS